MDETQNTVLRKRSQTEENTHCMSHLYEISRKAHKERQRSLAVAWAQGGIGAHLA